MESDENRSPLHNIPCAFRGNGVPIVFPPVSVVSFVGSAECEGELMEKFREFSSI